MLGGEVDLAFRHLSRVYWYGLPHLLFSLTTWPTLIIVLAFVLSFVETCPELGSGVCICGCAWAAFHRRL